MPFPRFARGLGGGVDWTENANMGGRTASEGFAPHVMVCLVWSGGTASIGQDVLLPLLLLTIFIYSFQPRHLPTARITPTSSYFPFLSSLSSSATAPLPSPLKPLIPLLWELARLLSIVPAVFGTLYNLYYVFFPPRNSVWWRVDFFVSALWVSPPSIGICGIT